MILREVFYLCIPLTGPIAHIARILPIILLPQDQLIIPHRYTHPHQLISHPAHQVVRLLPEAAGHREVAVAVHQQLQEAPLPAQ